MICNFPIAKLFNWYTQLGDFACTIKIYQTVSPGIRYSHKRSRFIKNFKTDGFLRVVVVDGQGEFFRHRLRRTRN